MPTKKFFIMLSLLCLTSIIRAVGDDGGAVDGTTTPLTYDMQGFQQEPATLSDVSSRRSATLSKMGYGDSLQMLFKLSDKKIGTSEEKQHGYSEGFPSIKLLNKANAGLSSPLDTTELFSPLFTHVPSEILEPMQIISLGHFNIFFSQFGICYIKSSNDPNNTLFTFADFSLLPSSPDTFCFTVYFKNSFEDIVTDLKATFANEDKACMYGDALNAYVKDSGIVVAKDARPGPVEDYVKTCFTNGMIDDDILSHPAEQLAQQISVAPASSRYSVGLVLDELTVTFQDSRGVNIRDTADKIMRQLVTRVHTDFFDPELVNGQTARLFYGPISELFQRANFDELLFTDDYMGIENFNGNLKLEAAFKAFAKNVPFGVSVNVKDFMESLGFEDFLS